MLMFGRNQHNSVKQLSFNYKINKFKIKKKKKNTGVSSPGKPFPSPGLATREFGCNVGDPGSIPELGRSPKEGHENPLQYSYLDTGA